ncbi:MAG: glycosyltransferase [candidate division KSB1 bacterium]|nr:glycosyltransferase [candidate division KSB1 bacterium]
MDGNARHAARPARELSQSSNTAPAIDSAQPISGTTAPPPKIKAPSLSIIVPLFNEAESLPELYHAISRVLQRMRARTEIIFVDDGSTDHSFEVLSRLQHRDRRVRVIQFRRNQGKSAALAAGFARAQGRQIVTLDADLQDDPEEIPHLLRELNKGYDLISGWKKHRRDKLTKRLASKIFNLVTNFVTGVKLHDINCGLKAYRREVTDSIRVYGQLHRYLPVLAFKEGFRIGEVEVRHHARKYGKSKFGLSRYTSGFFDLLTVLFLTRYTKRPLHLFGLAGLIFFLCGFGVSAYLTYERLFAGRYLSNRPLLFLGVLLIIVGVQMVSLGLLGEMIASTHSRAPTYTIKSELGFDTEDGYARGKAPNEIGVNE